MYRYTTKQRQQIASALRGCKKRLSRTAEDDKKRMICFALSESIGGDLAREVISSRLSGSGTVTNWLFKQGFIEYRFYSRTDVQLFRHRWVNALIKEFSV